jgi:AAA domain
MTEEAPFEQDYFDSLNDLGEPVANAAHRCGASHARPKFNLEPWDAIHFEPNEEWLAKHVLPRRGIAVLYGKSGSFKSFIATDLSARLALGWGWAGRHVTQVAIVYIAAEGAAGLRKRKIGFERAHSVTQAPFYLVSAAPNLDSARGDFGALVDAIEQANVTPGLIVIDTLARTLGSADENGPGMIQFIANAAELAARFKALVLIIHHVGLSDDRRMRGHSSLNAAVDAQILCEREEGSLSTVLTVQKVKDEISGIRLKASLSRIVIDHDADGEEISTLVVDSIENAGTAASKGRPNSVPRSQWLLMRVLAEALEEAGESIRPFGQQGPNVRAVKDRIVRDRYYKQIAETADPSEEQEKLAARQRKAFNRAVMETVKTTRVMAREHNGERFLWLP